MEAFSFHSLIVPFAFVFHPTTVGVALGADIFGDVIEQVDPLLIKHVTF